MINLLLEDGDKRLLRVESAFCSSLEDDDVTWEELHRRSSSSKLKTQLKTESNIEQDKSPNSSKNSSKSAKNSTHNQREIWSNYQHSFSVCYA